MANTAEEARLQGNNLYKAKRINDAIKAYKVAAALAPSDPAPLSNLSAATFETGDYENCVHFGTEALTLLEAEAQDDPRKQKLFTRLAEAKLHQCRVF